MKSILIFGVFVVLLKANFVKGRKCFPFLVFVVCNKSLATIKVEFMTLADRGP